MITVDAVINKSQISEFGAIKGTANLASVEVGGHSFAAGELMFCGFAGAREDDKRYHGVFRFEKVEPDICKRIPFGFLTNPTRTQTTKPRASKPKDN